MPIYKRANEGREGRGDAISPHFSKGKTLASADLIDGEKLKLLGHYGKI